MASIKRRQIELKDSVSMKSDLVANLHLVKLLSIEKRMGRKKNLTDLEEKIVIIETYNRRAKLLLYYINETPNFKLLDILLKVFIHLGMNERKLRQRDRKRAPPFTT